jgi:hypothetical protein
MDTLTGSRGAGTITPADTAPLASGGGAVPVVPSVPSAALRGAVISLSFVLPHACTVALTPLVRARGIHAALTAIFRARGVAVLAAALVGARGGWPAVMGVSLKQSHTILLAPHGRGPSLCSLCY